MWLNLKRVLKSAFVNFWRNSIVSAASIFVMVVTLFLFGSIIMSNAFLGATLAELEDKVDINVYFKQDAPESEIEDLREQIEALPEVESIEYLTRGEVLEQFRQRNEDNSLITQTLEELGENPFGAVFNIKAKQPSQYEGIATFLSEHHDSSELGESDNSIIDDINFFRNKEAIDRLSGILDTARAVGLLAGLILAIMAVLVTFNTIRLTIYVSREEIEVMKLVGASPSFIRGPFVIEGVMYGLFSGIIAMALLYPVTFWVTDKTADFFGGVNLFSYYTGNFAQLLLILIVSGIVLGVISSYFAVRRYLKLK